MNKSAFKFFALALAASVSAGFTSCSDDNDDFIKEPSVKLLTFDGSQNILAGPTSYGDNCYAAYTGSDRYTSAEFGVTEGVTLKFGINRSIYYGDQPDFSAGGIALSQWNIRQDISGKPSGWWKTYENQMSLYNVSVPSGQNDGNTFLVVNSNPDKTYFEDPETYIKDGQSPAPAVMQFSAGKEFVIDAMYICPNSYLYGAVTEGTPYSLEPNVPLKDQHGWFKLLIHGFDSNGNITNGGQPVEYTLCDYRQGNEVDTALPMSWTAVSLEKLGKVNKIAFSFDGSDKGEYGLNTPAYICVDQMYVNLIKMD